jgi:hypothetical protein
MAQPSGYQNPNAKGNKSAAKGTSAKAKNNGQPSGYRNENESWKQGVAPHTIKVSQHTIDSIKRLGMKKALELAKMNAKATQAGLVAEYMEATRRLYGKDRVAKATAPKPKKPSTQYSPAPYKAPKPKSGGGSNSKVK